MPRPSKKSAQALSQRKTGSKSFGTPQNTVSDTGSVYNSESEDDNFSSDEENNTVALRTLYTNILPSHLKVNQVDQFKIRQLMGTDKNTQSKKRNRPVRYNGDSRTSDWRQRKKWKRAADGCEKVDSYFQVSNHKVKMREKLK